MGRGERIDDGKVFVTVTMGGKQQFSPMFTTGAQTITFNEDYQLYVGRQ
jgi:hypothetical protein